MLNNNNNLNLNLNRHRYGVSSNQGTAKGEFKDFGGGRTGITDETGKLRLVEY